MKAGKVEINISYHRDAVWLSGTSVMSYFLPEANAIRRELDLHTRARARYSTRTTISET